MIEFSSRLHKGRLIRRYKRFFADVELEDGTEVIAHCPNTGTMMSCADPGSIVMLTSNDSPTRKLKYTWELTATNGGWIGVNTHRANAVVYSALVNGYFSEFRDFPVVSMESTWRPGTRFDFGLCQNANEAPQLYLEVKNVTLFKDGVVTFPDCQSLRARKHALELAEVVKSGKRAVLLFLINRPEAVTFRPAWEIDPLYAEAVMNAHKAGVDIWAIRCLNDENGSRLTEPIKVDLNRHSNQVI